MCISRQDQRDIIQLYDDLACVRRLEDQGVMAMIRERDIRSLARLVAQDGVVQSRLSILENRARVLDCAIAAAKGKLAATSGKNKRGGLNDAY